MFSTTDTIVAIATPHGRGGIGVVRLSGPDAELIALRLTERGEAFTPRHATLTTVRAADGTLLDRAIVTSFPSPASYTGEDVVEISAHGSPVVLRAIVMSAISRGARLAGPGEFTLRAYLNARIDLTQAEAIADLIDASTPLQARAAFDQLSGTLATMIGDIDRSLFDLVARLEASVDFPDEGYHFVRPGELGSELVGILTSLDGLLAGSRRGRLIREGRQVVIVGPPNAGKSSLFNALVGTARAIVTPIPGTTRDLVTEVVDIEGVRVTLVDTAGLRETADQVEAEGVLRARKSLDVANLILEVSDLSRTQPEAFGFSPNREKTVRVGTKCDLPHQLSHADLSVSVVTGEGLDQLRLRIAESFDRESLSDLPAMTNVRHVALVERARVSVERAREAAMTPGGSLPEEFVLADLQDARAALEEVTGKRSADDVLNHIFSNFCIGK